MKIIISFTDGTSEEITYTESDPTFDDESQTKIQIINRILHNAGKTWDDITRIKELE